MCKATTSLVLMLACVATACGEGSSCRPGETVLADGGCEAPVDSGADDDAGNACERDVDCDDGIFCNGVELCRPAASAADSRGCVAPSASPCVAGQSCDEAGRLCITDCADGADADGDGYDAVECGGVDCDDSDADRYPANPERCDMKDQDCDDSTLAGSDGDADGDGFIDAMCCAPNEAGELRCGRDCDDSMSGVNPGSPESCNETDDDCDGTVDEGLLSRFFRDNDGDLYGTSEDSITACVRPAGYAPVDGDCDDADRGISPVAREICDSIDQDCDTIVDEAAEELGSREHCGACFDECQFECLAGGACDVGIEVGAGERHSCVLMGSGRIFCWGEGGSGQLGQGSSASSTRPVQVSGVVDAVELSVGGNHSCFFDARPSLWCFGRNDHGQLGDVSFSDSNVPVRVRTVSDIPPAQVAAGHSHTCYFGTRSGGDGAVACWGEGTFRQNGHNADLAAPRAVAGVSTDVMEVAAGGSHTCALTRSGEVQCWGNNGDGQLGGGSAGPATASPTSVSGLTDATALGIGASSSYVIRSGGSASGWGRNRHWQIGTSMTGNAFPSPVPVAISGATEITGGSSHGCAIAAAGAMCWGVNNGTVGDGTIQNRQLPTAVSGGNRFVTLAAGDVHSCALDADGVVWCWGRNGAGQLGDGTTADRRSPVRVVVP